MKEKSIQTNHTIAIYKTHDKAEDALKLLSSEGFEMNHLSIIGRDYETAERPIGFINTGERMMSWGRLGAFWGSIWGLLLGSAMMFIPGFGYLMFAGYIVSAIEGAAIGGGLAALGGALASIGIPKNSVVQYESELKAGNFIVLAHGNEAESNKAKEILASTSPTNLQSYANRETAAIR